MKVFCTNKKCKNFKKGELIHSGHYCRYPSRYSCSECGSRVRPNKVGARQIRKRWQMKNLSEGVMAGRITEKQMKKALKES